MRFLSLLFVGFFLSLTSVHADNEVQPNVGEIKNVNSLFGALTLPQKLEDYQYVVSTLRSAYGPLARKAETAKLNFDEHVSATEKLIRESDARGEKDQEFYNLITQFINRFQDKHLGFNRPDIRNVTLGFGISRAVRKVGDKEEEIAIISSINRELLTESKYPIFPGDLLIEIAGQTPSQLADSLASETNWSAPKAKRDVLFALIPARQGARHDIDKLTKLGAVEVKIQDKNNIVHTLHLSWLGTLIGNRPALVQGKQPQFCVDGFCETSNFLKRVNSKADGQEDQTFLELPSLLSSIDNCNSIQIEDLPEWENASGTKQSEAHIYSQKPFADELGVCTLHFADKKVPVKIGIVPLDSFDVTPKEAYRALYRRIFTYMEENVSGVIIDTRGNPGGNFEYLHYLLSLLTNKTMDMGTMTLPLTRETYREIAEAYAKSARGSQDHALYRKMLEDFESAVAAKKTHLEKVDFVNGRDIMPIHEKGYKPYTKQLYVLTDSFCASCADWFPGVLKANGRSINIGTNTTGAGGHVAKVGPLANGGGTLSITYSLIQLSNGDLIEDLGVEPHHSEIRPTQEDYRKGYRTENGYRDMVLKIVRQDLEEKVVRPNIEKQKKELEEALQALDKK